MKNKIIISVLIILALIAVFLYWNKNDSGWSVYKDKIVGFEFKYPTNIPSRERLVIKELDTKYTTKEKIIAWGPEGLPDNIFVISYEKENTNYKNIETLVKHLEEISGQKSEILSINGNNFFKISLIGEECASNYFVTSKDEYIISITKDIDGTCFYSGIDLPIREIRNITDIMLNSFQLVTSDKKTERTPTLEIDLELAGKINTKTTYNDPAGKYKLELPSVFEIKYLSPYINLETKTNSSYFIRGNITIIKKTDFTPEKYTQQEIILSDVGSEIIKEVSMDAGGIMVIYTICTKEKDYCVRLLAGSDEQPTGDPILDDHEPERTQMYGAIEDMAKSVILTP